MMKTKDLILAACVATTITAASAFAFAGDKPHRAPEPAAIAEKMQKKLQLNDTQRQQVQQILETSKQQRETLAQKYTIAQHDAYRDEVKNLREQSKQQIDALLTPAQREAMAAQRGKHGEHGKHGWGRGDCAPQKAPEAAAAN